jgi:hypothetical protein
MGLSVPGAVAVGTGGGIAVIIWLIGAVKYFIAMHGHYRDSRKENKPCFRMSESVWRSSAQRRTWAFFTLALAALFWPVTCFLYETELVGRWRK